MRSGLGVLTIGLITGWMGIVSAPLGHVQAAGPLQRAAGASPASVSAQRAILDRYCVTCHSEAIVRDTSPAAAPRVSQLRALGLALDAVDMTNVSEAPEIWEEVVRKLKAGVMPPAGRPRPDKASYDGLASWLETELDRASAADPNPGRTEPFHRLNRIEYQNAIRDLLALEIDVSSLLPTDDSSYGFDNIAGVLKMSPTLLERYLSAAQKISRLAVGTPALFPNIDAFRIRPDLPQDDRVDGLSFGTRGGTLIRYNFPLDGEYLIQVRLARKGTSGGEEVDIPRFAQTHQLELSLDGERLRLFTLAGETVSPEERGNPLYGQGSRQDLDADWQVRLPVKAGPREVRVAFLKKSSAAVETVRLPFLRPYAGAGGDTRYQPYLSVVTISGPFGASRSGDTPSRDRLFVCRPVSPADADESACAREILATLARRAYRRPVTNVDVEMLLVFYRDGRAEGGFDVGIQRALERLLVSPPFLLRIERDPAGVAADTNYPVSDLELASRLSFFLWSSLPDDELLDVAIRGTLHEPAVLERQVRRMLADDRSQALVNNFAAQWLFLRNVQALAPDLDAFPDFDESLRQDLRRETELFVESILREDRSVLDLLTASYTFVNERLARHYGIPNVKGSHFRRITLTDDNRRGLLGHGSILAVTAYPHRTSPVLRGKWILENLLGTPPPAPPADVPALEEANDEGKALSMREATEQHRRNPVCASCHRLMDPLGFALENFDAVGRWRDRGESFTAIDSSGILPDGSVFEGPAGLRDALLSQPERFVSTLTEKLLTYALGRGLEYYDTPAVRAITRDAARNEDRFSSVIMGIVNSMPFQMRRSQS